MPVRVARDLRNVMCTGHHPILDDPRWKDTKEAASGVSQNAFCSRAYAAAKKATDGDKELMKKAWLIASVTYSKANGLALPTGAGEL